MDALTDTWRLCVAFMKISIFETTILTVLMSLCEDSPECECPSVVIRLIFLFSILMCAHMRMTAREAHGHIHTRYMYTFILLHGLPIVQTCVGAYIPKLCYEVHEPHTHTHTHTHTRTMLRVLGIKHSLPTPARPSQILISLIMSLLMRATIPTDPSVFTMPLA